MRLSFLCLQLKTATVERLLAFMATNNMSRHKFKMFKDKRWDYYGSDGNDDSDSD